MNEELKDTIPLSSIILDPRNEEELVERAQVRVFNESKGLLNDFTDNSPLAALIQGQAFAGAELLYYLNQLPLALVIDFLKITGVERVLGTKAVVTLQFTLTTPLSITFTVPQGFEVIDQTGNYSFFTDSILNIPPGLVSGSVTATAEKIGSAYNLPAYSINGLTQPLTYINSVTNPQPSAGGTEAETEVETIKRGLDNLRLRNLVSAKDYEQSAESILGVGSRAKAIGLLGPNKEDEELGAVHLFLLNESGDPASSTQTAQVRSILSERIQLGSALYVSPMELLPIDAFLIAKLTAGRDPEEVVDELYMALDDYLNPSKYAIGEDVILNELEYVLRLTGGIKYVELLEINGNTLNIPLGNDFTLPYLNSLSIQLIREDGTFYEASRGQLDNL